VCKYTTQFLHGNENVLPPCVANLEKAFRVRHVRREIINKGEKMTTFKGVKNNQKGGGVELPT